MASAPASTSALARSFAAGVRPCADVGACHDEEVRVAAGVGGGADAFGGGVQVHDVLAVEVAAALGVELVLDMQPGEAGVLELLDGAGHVHGFAEAGVGVDDGGQVGHAGDLPGPGGYFGEGGQADVGQAEVVGQHCAGDVDAGKALFLR
jgi:hypothetical protein